MTSKMSFVRWISSEFLAVSRVHRNFKTLVADLFEIENDAEWNFDAKTKSTAKGKEKLHKKNMKGEGFYEFLKSAEIYVKLRVLCI